MENIIVWDVNNTYELELSQSLQISWFENAEIQNGVDKEHLIKSSNKKKIVLIDWWLYNSVLKGPQADLSWADLVICFTTELIHANWKEFYHYTKDYFRNNNIIFIVGGSTVDDYDPQLVFLPNLSFFLRVSRANDPVEYDITNSRPFMFDALLGQKNSNRIKIFQQLQNKNLLARTICNLENGKYSSNFDIPNYRTSQLDQWEEPVINNFRQQFNHQDLIDTASAVNLYYKDSHHKVWASQIVPVNIYKNSWYSLVAETDGANYIFVTEKTSKCFFAKRIFVCFASPGHLAMLKNQGYETFSEIIDESYDLETDSEKRISKIIDQLRILSESDPVKLYQKVKPILDHNFNLINTPTKQMAKIKNFIQQHSNL